jgi:hypothetical protein
VRAAAEMRGAKPDPEQRLDSLFSRRRIRTRKREQFRRIEVARVSAKGLAVDEDPPASHADLANFFPPPRFYE